MASDETDSPKSEEIADTPPAAQSNDGSATSDDRLLTVAKVWDELSTYERLKLLAYLCGLIAAVGGGGFAFATMVKKPTDVSGLVTRLEALETKTATFPTSKTVDDLRKSVSVVGEKNAKAEQQLNALDDRMKDLESALADSKSRVEGVESTLRETAARIEENRSARELLAKQVIGVTRKASENKSELEGTTKAAEKAVQEIARIRADMQPYAAVVTPFSEATDNQISLAGYVKEVEDLKNGRNTWEVERKEILEFNKSFGGHKVTWTGYVLHSQRFQLNSRESNYGVQFTAKQYKPEKSSPALDAPVPRTFKPGTFIASVFSDPTPTKTPVTKIEQLRVGQKVQFSAVFDGHGGLYHLKIRKVY